MCFLSDKAVHGIDEGNAQPQSIDMELVLLIIGTRE
jgi:hypothetical protein